MVLQNNIKNTSSISKKEVILLKKVKKSKGWKYVNISTAFEFECKES